MKVTVKQMGLTEYRICQTISGRFFIQYFKETDGFWTLTGEPKAEWIALPLKDDPKYYVHVDAARDAVMVMIQTELEAKAMKLGVYKPLARLLSFDITETSIMKKYMEVSDGD